jgi:hypothetical protein
MFHRIIAVVGCFFAVACGSGAVRVNLTDAPLEGVSAVNVTIASVEAHFAGGEGWTTLVSEEQTFNLLELRDGVIAKLGEVDVPAGKITQMRLHLSESAAPSIVDADGEHAMGVPSGYQSGIKLVGCFDVAADETTEITLDFDAAESVHVTGNGAYEMRPTIKILTPATCSDDEEPAQE